MEILKSIDPSNLCWTSLKCIAGHSIKLEDYKNSKTEFLKLIRHIVSNLERSEYMDMIENHYENLNSYERIITSKYLSSPSEHMKDIEKDISDDELIHLSENFSFDPQFNEVVCPIEACPYCMSIIDDAHRIINKNLDKRNLYILKGDKDDL